LAPVPGKRGNPLGKKRTIESYLPLTPAVFHVLLALADGEKHGYIISKEIVRLTESLSGCWTTA
jgi:hypothetical protein